MKIKNFEKKIFSLIIFYVLFFSIAVSETIYPVTADEFIRQSESDAEIMELLKKNDFLDKASANSPLINELQFRYQFEDMLNKNRYSLRFKFNGFGERSGSGKVLELNRQISRLQSDILFSQVLKERYNLLAQLYYYTSLNEQYDKAIKLLSETIPAIADTGKNDAKKISDYVKMEIDLDNYQLKKLEAAARIKETEQKINCIIGDGKIDFDRNSIAAVDRLNADVRNNQNNFIINDENIYLKNEILKLDIRKEETGYDEARERRYLDFVDIGIDTGDREKKKKDETVLRVGLGINLPFISSEKTEINVRKARIIEENGVLVSYKTSLQRQLDGMLSEFNSLVQQYELLLNARSVRNADKYLKYMKSANLKDPVLSLEIYENIIRRDIKLESIKSDIFQIYFELLDLSGIAVRNKSINYITNNERLQPVK